MGSQEFPTTDNYKIGTNVNLHSQGLSEHFHDIVQGKPSSIQIPEMVKSLLGRDDIKVTVGDHSKNKYSFGADGDEIHLDPEFITIAKFLGVSEDNLPPNVPTDLTHELFGHLIALHEAEHATQLHLPKDQDTGKVDLRSVRSNLVADGVSEIDLNNKIVRETDADVPVLEHLRDMELEHVGQFWKDSRMTVSFVNSFPMITDEALRHDSSSLLSYHQATGKVIDLDTFVSEKKALLNNVHKELGFEEGKFMSIMQDYPDLLTSERAAAAMSSQEVDDSLRVTPQAIQHAVQNLLDKGELSEMQAWEAQNYVNAMGRLGYEADPNFDYEANIRDTLENKIGLKSVSQQSIDASDNTADSIHSVELLDNTNRL